MLGRPLKFQSIEELQPQIDAYFVDCDEKNRPYTMTGLALALSTTRETLLEYENLDQKYIQDLKDSIEKSETSDIAKERSEELEKYRVISDSIKKAKTRIHNYAEESLWRTGIATGVIFNLKNNWNWKDKNETDLNHSGGLTVEVTKYNQ